MKNYVTNKEYTGVNFVTLTQSGYAQPWFLTFKQAESIGRKVKKGSKGIRLIRIITRKIEDPETGKEKTVKSPKGFTVFNIEQTEKVWQDTMVATKDEIEKIINK